MIGKLYVINKYLCKNQSFTLGTLEFVELICFGMTEIILPNGKVKKILKGSPDLIPSPSPSLKIQIMGGKVCLKCKGKTLLGVVTNPFVFKSLLTTSSNVLLLHLSRP